MSWLSVSPILAVLMREFRVSHYEGGLLASGSLILSPLGILSGFLCDRYGARKMVVILGILQFIPSFLSGLAESYNSMLALRVMVGIAPGVFVAATKLIADLFPAEQMGTAQGVVGGAIPGGVFLVSLVMPALTINFGWRAAFFTTAIPLLVFVLLTPFLIKPYGYRGNPASMIGSLAICLRSWQVWILCLVNIVTFGTAVAFIAWFPTFFNEVYQLSLSSAGLLTSVIFGIGVVSRPMGGMFGDRWGMKRSLMLSLSFLTVSYIILSVISAFEGALVSALLAAWFFSFGTGPLYALAPLLFPQHAGAVFGLMASMSALGGFILPPVFGALIDITQSYNLGFTLLAFVSLIGTVISYRIRTPSKS